MQKRLEELCMCKLISQKQLSPQKQPLNERCERFVFLYIYVTVITAGDCMQTTIEDLERSCLRLALIMTILLITKLWSKSIKWLEIVNKVAGKITLRL